MPISEGFHDNTLAYKYGQMGNNDRIARKLPQWKSPFFPLECQYMDTMQIWDGLDVSAFLLVINYYTYHCSSKSSITDLQFAFKTMLLISYRTARFERKAV